LAIGEDDYWGTRRRLEDDALTAGKLKGFFDDYLEADFAAKDYDAGALKLYTALTDYLAEVLRRYAEYGFRTVSSDTNGKSNAGYHTYRRRRKHSRNDERKRNTEQL
jgi:hypothetical protein